MNFLNKSKALTFEQVKQLQDNTKIYVESVFSGENSFVGVKIGNKVYMPNGNYWVLAADFRELCKAYEYLEVGNKVININHVTTFDNRH